MKRVRIYKKLKQANTTGWLAEFPQELFSLMFASIRPDKNGVPELGLMMSLMGTCKMFFQLLKESVISLLCELLCFDGGNDHTKAVYESGKDTFFLLVSEVLETVTNHFNPKDYLRECLYEPETHQTVGHLTNALSLIRLAYMEGKTLYKSFFDHFRMPGYFKYVYKGLPLYYNNRHQLRQRQLANIKYFDPVTKKARCLYRMIDKVAIKERGLYAKQYALSILLRKVGGCNVNLKERVEKATHPFSMEDEALFIRIITESGVVIPTTRATTKDYFDDLIVTIDKKQYSIFSEEAKLFRAQCFKSRKGQSVEDATMAYILDRNHVRNWAIVTGSGRYNVNKDKV